MVVAQPAQQQVNPKALTWTILVHALLLLLFFLWKYNIPVAVVEEGTGLEVNLGSSEDGSGNDQPMNPADPSNYSAAVVYKDVAAKNNLPEDILRSDNPDDAALNSKNNSKELPGQAKKNEKTEPKPVPKSVYGGTTSGGGNKAQQSAAGTNEGNGNGPGDKGVAGGTPGAANYTGVPGTGGMSHTLAGRDINPKRFEAEFREGGTVVVRVTVDRDGNIVNKFVKSSSNPQLTRLALEKLSKAKFSKSGGTEPQQFGDVTFIFKSR